jgi:Ser/Thr protein kinase RdoA (MazF antagonist)
MSLLQQAPRFDLAGAARLARELYGLDASASLLPSERDQNFLLATRAGDRYVLKVANATENRAMLEAQNAAMAHVADREAFCPRVLPTIAGGTIGAAPDSGHLVRLVTYLDGIPLAEAGARSAALLESLGRAVGRLDRALEDFDHPAIHRDFHWDLARAASVIGEHLPLVLDGSERQLVQRVSASALQAIGPRQPAFRRSAVHHDANDWNVLVSNPEPRPTIDGGRAFQASRNARLKASRSVEHIVGIIDFGDMVHSWTVADPAVAVAYAMLDTSDPLATSVAIVRGYHAEHPLRDEELGAVFPLACLRLCMSACIAAWQQRQRPDDEYLAVSQGPIRRTLPALAAILRSSAQM